MSVPTLSDDEICSKLNEIFEMNVTIEDLNNCSSEFVKTIYSTFLMDFGAYFDELNQVSTIS